RADRAPGRCRAGAASAWSRDALAHCLSSTARTSQAGLLCRLLGAFPQRLGFLPEFLPIFTLVLGKFAQRLGAADAGEILVLLPMLHGLLHHGAQLIRFLVQQ